MNNWQEIYDIKKSTPIKRAKIFSLQTFFSSQINPWQLDKIITVYDWIIIVSVEMKVSAEILVWQISDDLTGQKYILNFTVKAWSKNLGVFLKTVFILLLFSFISVSANGFRLNFSFGWNKNPLFGRTLDYIILL